MVKCCLQPDALGHFLALLAKVGLIVAALDELARTPWLSASDVERNADTLGSPVVARYTDADYIHTKS